MESRKFKTVDEYISALSGPAKKCSKQLRQAIKEAAPDAEEVISYNMPLFKFHGRLVYFAAHANHIGFYPFTSAMREFKDKLKRFKTSTGTIQFPFEKGIPVALVKSIVKFRMKENLEKRKSGEKKIKMKEK